jgi:hypothetical protein
VYKNDGGNKSLLLPVFTVALVLALLAGIAWQVADGVSSFNGKSNGRVTGEGASLMNRVEALIKSTRVINDPLPLIGSRSYDFLADVDGDNRTGTFEAPGQEKGLERVVIYRPSERSAELRVEVRTVPDGSPSSTVLTRDLDSNDPRAFSVDCKLESPVKNGETTNRKSGLSEKPVSVTVALVLGWRRGKAVVGQKLKKVIPLLALVLERNP